MNKTLSSNLRLQPPLIALRLEKYPDELIKSYFNKCHELTVEENILLYECA